MTAKTTPALETAVGDGEASDGGEKEQGHVSVRNLPARVTLEDEQYNFFSDPRVSGVKVVAEWDRDSYVDDQAKKRKKEMGELQPAIWCREGGSGSNGSGEGGDEGSVKCRVWYTSLGHSEEIWGEEWFMEHVFGGIEWALRM